ncbi:hypothetical protein CO669_26000 [Bradyrhizobium sp. Y36]|uniref:lipopolysaccharide biosynthesis protein n=1 Tax=Bradyrhizobium sp. Y36 TaxID=2035447 RepID=UPI000BEE5125|nr:lipopolysaccharide biosynthesis protein [Bradyrhizobium sp. Y36]PDT87310.1 hypothetical protein CO669_26000 [Bradyrhizobium sp. Y36]
MSVNRATAFNTITNLVGLGLNASLQILQVPLLISIWSLDQYGTWLMLSTIPTYFALSDFGFATAATSDMTMSFARGDKKNTTVTYQSIWLMLVVLSVLAVALTSPIVLLQGRPMGASLNWLSEYAVDIFLFVCYSAVSLCSRVLLAGLRSTGNYAVGTFSYEFLSFLEAMLLVAIAWTGFSFGACILAMTVWRCFSMIVLDQILRRSVGGMALGFSKARLTEIRRLAYPAIAAMTVPIALAINIQGIVLVVGSVLSPQAVAVFNPVRTASRIALQLASALNRGSMPEMSRAASTGDTQLLRHVLRANAASVVAVLLPGALAFSLFGGVFVRHWTLGRIDPDGSFIALMAVAMFLQGLWFFSSNLMVAVNRHTKIAKFLLLISVLALGGSIPACRYYGLNGVASVLVLAELSSFLIVVRICLKDRVFSMRPNEAMG